MLGKILVVAGLCFVALPAQAQDSATRSDDQIIVTGTPLSATQKALADCMARHCPPDQEIAAAIAHAENQFVAGRYSDARATLSESSRRNKRYAAQYPVPVSNVLRAGSRVALHLGLRDAYFSGALDVISALKAGLASDDSRVLVARTELADAYVRTGRMEAASELYRHVAAQAKRQNLPLVEGFARFREAALWSMLAQEDAVYRGNANAKLDAVIASTDPTHEPFVKAAKVLRTRLAARAGDSSAVDALIAEYRSHPARHPLLLASKPIRLGDLRERDQGESGSVTKLMAVDDFNDQWIDVSFWIGPDGRPTDVDVIRDSGKTSRAWTDPVLASVRSRRYAPLALGPTDPGLLRVERYTFTADWVRNTGSRMKVRENKPRIEMLDLSTEDAAPAAVKVESKG